MNQLLLSLSSDEEIKAQMIKSPNVIEQLSGFPSIINQAIWLPKQINEC